MTDAPFFAAMLAAAVQELWPYALGVVVLVVAVGVLAEWWGRR